MDGPPERKIPTNPVAPRAIREKNGLDGATASSQVVAPSYERQLERDPTWALIEGSRHFEEKSAVFDMASSARKSSSRYITTCSSSKRNRTSFGPSPRGSSRDRSPFPSPRHS